MIGMQRIVKLTELFLSLIPCPYFFSYGCTGNKCWYQEERSVVWVTPTQDADIYVDYNNSGDPNDYAIFPTDQLRTLKLADKGDTDMSGAVIFATKPGTGHTGPPVDIAAAWGQNPEVSRRVSP